MTEQLIRWIWEAVEYRKAYMEQMLLHGTVEDIAEAQEESYRLMEVWEDAAELHRGTELGAAFGTAQLVLGEATWAVAHDRRCHYYWDADRPASDCQCHDVDWVAMGVSL